MFCSVSPSSATCAFHRTVRGADLTIRAQPHATFARLMPVIADPTRHPGRHLALELLLRAAAIAAAATVILGLLPAIARAVG